MTIIEINYDLGNGLLLTQWHAEDASYQASDGRCFYSGAAEPSQADAEDCVANPAPAPAVPVPHEVPLWAIRAVLDLEGLTASINSILAQLPEPGRTVVNRVWEYGNYIRRDSPTVSQLTVALGKTTEEVDGYFRQAAALNP